MNYLRFFVYNWKILLFAIVFTFFSGFGQTFLLSLYIPSFLKDFSISHTYYSTLYAGATLLSGFSIIFAGKFIDRVKVKLFALLVVFGIALANLVASYAFNVAMLFLSVFLLRFFGQGLLSHTAMTAMGKFFSKARGKALSIAYLGFPVAEAAFPIAIVSTIALVGWRLSFRYSAVAIIAVLLPLVLFLLYRFRKEDVKEDISTNKKLDNSQEKHDERVWTQRQILSGKMFYLFAPTSFLVGFILTALFFFQTFIAEFKGWTIEWMALNITAYAVSSFVFSILAGPITDRLSAKRIFPFILFPLIIGLLFLILFSHPLATTLFWFFVGISAGLNPTVSNALYAEEYGTISLGSVRSLFTFVMIVSTALGPIVYSLLLEMDLTFNHIHIGIIAVIIVNIVLLFIATSKNKSITVSP